MDDKPEKGFPDVVNIPPRKEELKEATSKRHRFLLKQLMKGEIGSLKYCEDVRKLMREVERIIKSYNN